jgi:Tfp pilus assembly protein PilF
LDIVNRFDRRLASTRYRDAEGDHEIRIIIDLPIDLPATKGEPRSSPAFRKKVVEALERSYQGFRRLGTLEISVAEETVSVALTTDDGVNPVALALADLKAGRVDDGVSLLEFLHTSAPEDAEVLFLLGSCLSDRGDLPRAEAYLSRAVELQPRSADWLVNFGVVLSRMNKLVEAEEAFSKAVELAPGNPYAHRNLGACVARAGHNVAKAQKHLEQAVHWRHDPQSGSGWHAFIKLKVRPTPREAHQRVRRLNQEVRWLVMLNLAEAAVSLPSGGWERRCEPSPRGRAKTRLAFALCN